MNRKNLKIIIINTLFSFEGGTEIIAFNTYNKLKKEGCEAYFWATNKEPYIEDNYKYSSFFTPYNGGIKNYLKNPINYYYNQNAKNDLKKFINQVKPDLIHIHNRNVLSPSIFDVCAEIPTVTTIHDASFICPNGKLMFKNNQYCKNLYCQKKNLIPCIMNKCVNNSIEASIRRALLTYIYFLKTKNINKFITPSNALKQIILKAKVGINNKNIVTVNNFLTENELKTVPNYYNKNYFLYIGRLSNEKGVHYLLQAMRDLPKTIKLKIVGSGPEENNLKKYSKENNLDNIEFLGFKNREEITDIYQNCISTILPCNWFEIFGMTNIESFINGKPVIASNIGGIPEIVEDNINGLLFEPGNIEELKNCILKYWNNPELSVQHGKNGYQKAITQYTEDKYYNELIKIYEEVLNEKK